MTDNYQFQAEINQLMSLIINSFYSNRDIFLRELVSNASDAIDKHRHDVLDSGTMSDVQYHIRVTPNKDGKELVIEDNGIGMTKQDMIDNLGTIARSGTKAFMESQKTDGMIGQFGVGFYSAFLVAESVSVTSSKNGETHTWDSAASGTFTITQVDGIDKERHGTRIVLHLKDDHLEYMEEHRIRELIKKHNQFISHPIELYVTKTIEVEVEVESKEGDIEVIDEKTKKEVQEYEQLNTEQPIWTRNPNDVTEDEYHAFYKAISGDVEPPLAYKHFSVEGQLEYKGIIYIPKRAPFDMFENKKPNSVKLYVKRVFVTDDSEHLVPEWLSFVRGIVDSNDLPLNVSREFLQQDRILKSIQKTVVKKSVELIHELDDQQSITFYSQFSKNIKLGAYQDSKHRGKLVDALKYQTLNSESPMSLQTYLETMMPSPTSPVVEAVTEAPDVVEDVTEAPVVEDVTEAPVDVVVEDVTEAPVDVVVEDVTEAPVDVQVPVVDLVTDMYYMCGEDVKVMRESPFVQKFKDLGIDVLLMSDPIDEYLLQQMREYEHGGTKHKMVSITRENVKIPGDTNNNIDDDVKELCERMKSIIGDKVQAVKVSRRLVTSPCCIVTSEHGWSANMERIMKSQALKNDNGMSQFMTAKKTLEINSDHPFIKKLLSSDDIKKYTELLFETSLLESGFQVDDPHAFAQKIFAVMTE
jgi:molecular chaperone HtpG